MKSLNMSSSFLIELIPMFSLYFDVIDTFLHRDLRQVISQQMMLGIDYEPYEKGSSVTIKTQIDCSKRTIACHACGTSLINTSFSKIVHRRTHWGSYTTRCLACPWYRGLPGYYCLKYAPFLSLIDPYLFIKDKRKSPQYTNHENYQKMISTAYHHW